MALTNPHPTPVTEDINKPIDTFALTKNDALGPSVVRAGQRAEAFLSGGIPNGDLDPLGPAIRARRVHHLHLKVHADGALQVVIEITISELQENTRFAHAGVSDQQDLENVI